MMAMKAGSEAAFQVQVLNLAGFHSWRCYHTHDSRRSQKGFPDLVLIRPPELIFAELKTDSGRVRPEQQQWLDELREVAARGSYVEVYLWRPAQLQEIIDRLSRPALIVGDDMGVCPTCESDDVGATLVTGVLVCRARDCGATWSGVRRRIAA